MDLQCPSCRQPLVQTDFCTDCFVSAQPPVPGRFRSLLEGRLVAPPPAPPVVCSGPDLRAVHFEPSDWKTRVLAPLARQVARAGLALVCLAGAAAAVEAKLRHDAAGAARQQWAEMEYWSGRKNWPGVERAGLAALNRALRAHDRQGIAHSHALLGDLEVHRARWDSALQHYQAAVDLGHHPNLYDTLEKTRGRAQVEHRKEARQLLAEGRAALARKDFIKASSCASRACQLYSENQGTRKDSYQAHLLSARCLEKLGLLAESRQELEKAEKLWPGQAEVKALLALVQYEQERELASRPKPVRNRPRRTSVYDPKFAPGFYQPNYPAYRPNYPTYQPPIQSNYPTYRPPVVSRPAYPAYQPAVNYPTHQPAVTYPTFQSPTVSRPSYQPPSAYQPPVHNFPQPSYPTARR